MPVILTIEELSTFDLLDVLDDTYVPPLNSTTDFTKAQATEELKVRKITDEMDANKGGIRPTHPNL